MRNGVPTRGDRVAFRVGSVFLPNAVEVIAGLTEDAHLEGIVVDVSDSGTLPGVFAIVEIEPALTVIVPVADVRLTRGSADPVDAPDR
jgi:hypothetical protein